jgi:SAM-dependent methyltransferase
VRGVPQGVAHGAQQPEQPMNIERDKNDPANSEQATLWNGLAGQAWVELQDLLDRLFQPMQALLVDAVAASGARRVLDVGCGTGGTTLAIARRLGAAGHCEGLDLSAPMVATARDRAQREGSAATFVCADAQVHAFDSAGFDALVSRFGVMFFDDAVRAFTNLRRAAADGAHLSFIAWRGADENPFMTTAERAAAPLLPQLPPRRADGSGQFAFADRDHVARILGASGWSGVHIRPIDVTCTLPERELGRYLAGMGPVGAQLRQLGGPTREKVIATVRAAFEPFVQHDEVRFVAACWWVEGRAA